MSSKRKAAPASVAAADGTEAPVPKRRKLPEETAEGTTKAGLGYLEHLKTSRDKSGWLIATNFLNLPDKKKIPQYYRTVGLPMALDIIEGKLERREYADMTSLEGDFRRMISNAKSFNEKQSRVFSDAEKVRKSLSVFMIANNPAYKVAGHQPYTTPVPLDWQEKLDDDNNSPVQEADGEAAPEEEPEGETKPPGRRTRLVTHVGSSSAPANNGRGSSTPAVQDAEGAFEGFEGNTFQQAQEKIMTEMISYRDDRGQLIFAPFINLPSRALVDYYKIIKRPVCLKSAQKAVRGIKGRDKPTGSTFLKSWQAFDDEVSFVWKNARDYNEDNSDIFVLAEELESYFHRRLAEAKRVVAEPPQPKVKLRMPARSPDPPKITLKFGSQKGNISAAMSVDNDALKRQQDLVRAGASGHGPGIGSSSAPVAGRMPLERSGSTEHTMNGFKTEAKHGQSPGLSSIQPNGTSEAQRSPSAANTQMAPPINLGPRLLSGSPNPQAQTNGVGPTSNSSVTPFNTRLRPPGKDVSDALLTNLNISTHPGLKIAKHFSLDIPASATRTQQSVTITVPSAGFYMRITPTMSTSLMHRPSKTIVSCGNNRLQPLPQTQIDESDARRPIYETRMIPGVNTVDVEVIAGPPRGAAKVGTGQQEIEFEKITVFVHLQK